MKRVMQRRTQRLTQAGAGPAIALVFMAGQMDVREAVSSLYPQVDTEISGRKIHEDDFSCLTDTAENAWAFLIYHDRFCGSVL